MRLSSGGSWKSGSKQHKPKIKMKSHNTRSNPKVAAKYRETQKLNQAFDEPSQRRCFATLVHLERSFTEELKTCETLGEIVVTDALIEDLRMAQKAVKLFSTERLKAFEPAGTN